jgi:hypothetical protein
VFLDSISGLKRVARTLKMIEEMLVQDNKEPMKMLKKVQDLVHSHRRLSIRTMDVQLNLDKEIMRQILSDDLGMILRFYNAPALSSSFWPKNGLMIWNTHPIPLIWLRMSCGCFQK